MKCDCCGRDKGPFVTMELCRNVLNICVPAGCAAAFEYEWEHAVEESGLDLLGGIDLVPLEGEVHTPD